MAEDVANDSDGPLIDDNVIRIQLRKPSQRKWELRTRNLTPSVMFPTIQLFDCEGNILIETNDDNISIKSADYDDCPLRSTKSLRENDFRHILHGKPLRKHKTVSGGKIYTKIFKTPDRKNLGDKCVVRDSESVTIIPNTLSVYEKRHLFRTSSGEASPLPSDAPSGKSSFKSSDDETSVSEYRSANDNHVSSNTSSMSIKNCGVPESKCTDYSDHVKETTLNKSKSFNDCTRFSPNRTLRRFDSDITYEPPKNKVSFLNTYLKSLPTRTSPNLDWLALSRRKSEESEMTKGGDTQCRFCRWDNNVSETELTVPTDVAAECEFRKRLKIYRRGISEVEPRCKSTPITASCRRHSTSSLISLNSSSSDSVDEADQVLNRLKRRILKNKIRERKRSLGSKYLYPSSKPRLLPTQSSTSAQNVPTTNVNHSTMGSNISQHSIKGLKGRRARSSGDLCNGDSKSPTESSVRGSVVGDVMGWNRSLPNHLDGNRHLADYSRVNNNYGEFGSYNRRHLKGSRGLRYRVFKTGSDAEPVWKLQDPGCDQGYGSERSPEEDYTPPMEPAPSLEEYEEQLRAVYPFITDENTYTVVVEKDGRGLGMSVCGGAGLVRIRRLYPPQPAWRTGRLQPKDILLAANGIPLAGLSTYEALEVLRTTAARVELRVCRPPPDVLESVTPPDPPTPPARTPHPPHPPPDPLNCHPLHARLSATTSSATTSSSEGRGKREGSPEDKRPLHLPGLDRPMPVYDVTYGEFDIVMTKVNGSLGFTLRKEDHSALGHYVRALVREPALSDGRIQPGDRIIAVNDTPMSNMSHADAVAFLRACDSEVRLRLYRDHTTTPVSPLSPKEEPTDSDGPANVSKPKPPLRAEAVSMLYDLAAARRLTPDATDAARSPCLSPRKFRKLTKENYYEQPNCSRVKFTLDSLCIDGGRDVIIQEVLPSRAHSANVVGSAKLHINPKLTIIVPPQGYELSSLESSAPNIYHEPPAFPEPMYPVETEEPVSMPVVRSSHEDGFCHSNPAYQSAVLHTHTPHSHTSHTSGVESTNNSEALKDDGKGLKKWKGVTLSPDNERKAKVTDAQPKPKVVQKENVKPENNSIETSSEPTIVTVELHRGWNSRLGFSVQAHPSSGQSYISAVHAGSAAAKDGRLRRGDVILQVNDENVTSMKTPEVIELLRILRGSICITVLRPPNPQ